MHKAGIIWILLALIVLLVLAYFVFGGPRTADRTTISVQETATTTVQTINRAAARTQAQVDLTALRARAEAGETYASLESSFAQVRTRLAAAYQDTEGQAAQEWASLNADFDSFEASARAGTSNFLDSITNLIGRFSADVRVETAGE